MQNLEPAKVPVGFDAGSKNLLAGISLIGNGVKERAVDAVVYATAQGTC
ncbi:hypothetical protein [Thiolapillus sp.]